MKKTINYILIFVVLYILIFLSFFCFFKDISGFLNSFKELEPKKEIVPDWELLNFIETSEVVLKNKIKDKEEILDYSSFVYHKSKKKNIDPYLVLATGYAESGFNRNAIGCSGEKGVFQFIPSTAKWLLKDKYKWNIEKDLYQSTKLWFLYYERLSKLYNNDVQKILLGYNMGEGRLNQLLSYNDNIEVAKYIVYHRKNWKPYDEKVFYFLNKFKNII